MNFLADFKVSVPAGGKNWEITCAGVPAVEGELRHFRLEVKGGWWSVPLSIRVPEWAGTVEIYSGGKPVKATLVNGRLNVKATSGRSLDVICRGGIQVEDRRLSRLNINPGQVTRLKEVVLRDGPGILFSTVEHGRPTLLAVIDAKGRVSLRSSQKGVQSCFSVGVKADVDGGQSGDSVATGIPLWLGPWGSLPDRNHSMFVFDLVVVPEDSPAARAYRQLKEP